MSRSFRVVVLGVVGLAVVMIGGVWLLVWREGGGPKIPEIKIFGDDDTYTVERIDYTPPPPESDTLLVDDRLEDKHPTFDPVLVDRRPLGDWLVNASEAVVRLDVPMIKPDQDPEMGILRPSYAAAVTAAKGQVLPSVNLVDGKAKQFDDGLYAALDQAHYTGHGPTLKSHLQLFRRLQAKVAPGSEAADVLAAGLSFASTSDAPPPALSPGARILADLFRSQPVLSKPIAFYTWNPTLTDCFRVLRFFAQPVRPAVTVEVARALGGDPALLADYRKALAFYAKLTNPLVGHSPADFIGKPAPEPDVVVSLLPPSTSRETELFEKLFPRGLPPDADLMRALIAAIRSGKVDLKPKPGAGWYDHQVYALETLLLPGRGEEADKLLLTKSYKKRMLEAFQALITKRRETHARQAKVAMAEPTAMPRQLTEVRPRLRVEPCPSYYLCTARSYAFLAEFLESAVGAEPLKSLHGLRETGPRPSDLHAELQAMRGLFYGLYLLSAEDIGLKPTLLDGEPVDRAACERAATGWLASFRTDPDLAADTRVGVPVYHDPNRKTTRLWVTLGVRLAPLEARYVKPPRVRPEKEKTGEWKPVESYMLADVPYVIPVDEFAEVELSGGRILDRAELRALCDREKTKAAILEALRK